MSETISVLGGGWSVRAYVGELARLPGRVIGVNDAGVLAPRVDLVVSMDRLWSEYRWPLLMARPEPRPCCLRRSAVQNIAERPPWLTVFECDHTTPDFTDEPKSLNGTNSGGCALNRAYQLRPRRVILFGFDMNRDKAGRAYWFDAYPWARPGGQTSGAKYRSWVVELEIAGRQFAEAGIEVLNASPGSAITAFEKIKPEEVFE